MQIKIEKLIISRQEKLKGVLQTLKSDITLPTEELFSRCDYLSKTSKEMQQLDAEEITKIHNQHLRIAKDFRSLLEESVNLEASSSTDASESIASKATPEIEDYAKVLKRATITLNIAKTKLANAKKEYNEAQKKLEVFLQKDVKDLELLMQHIVECFLEMPLKITIEEFHLERAKAKFLRIDGKALNPKQLIFEQVEEKPYESITKRIVSESKLLKKQLEIEIKTKIYLSAECSLSTISAMRFIPELEGKVQLFTSQKLSMILNQYNPKLLKSQSDLLEGATETDYLPKTSGELFFGKKESFIQLENSQYHFFTRFFDIIIPEVKFFTITSSLAEAQKTIMNNDGVASPLIRDDTSSTHSAIGEDIFYKGLKTVDIAVDSINLVRASR